MPIISPKIPQGLEELMKGLAKSVIKENPENIYEFAAEYFENLLRERDGTVDQSYKKFATYKVYKKSKMERRKRDRENLSNIDIKSGNLKLENVSSMDEKFEKIALSESIQSPLEVSHDIMVSSESEINATVKQESFVEDEGTPQQKSVNSEEDEDVKGLVLDDEMSHAAVKIQSTFRGHRVRRDMKDNNQTNEEQKGSESADEMLESVDNTEIKDDIDDDMKGEMETMSKSEDLDECIAVDESQKDENVVDDDDNINPEAAENCEVDEEEKNQLDVKEIDDENIKQFDDGTGNNVEEDVINSKNCSTEANENELNDDEIVHDGKLSIENVDSTSLNEEHQNSVEDNVQEPENVPLMEADNNVEFIITKVESSENIEVNPLADDEQKEEEVVEEIKTDDVQAQVEDIEGQNVQVETENVGSKSQDNEDDDDVSAMVLDDEMEEAALKIQSAFRGHKVRKDMQQSDTNDIIDSSVDVPNEGMENLAESVENVIEELECNEMTVSTTDELNEGEMKIDENLKSSVEAIIEDEPLPENTFEDESTEMKTNSIEKASDVQSLDDKLEGDEISSTQSIEKCEDENEVEVVNLENQSSVNVEPVLEDENVNDKSVEGDEGIAANQQDTIIGQEEIVATSQDEVIIEHQEDIEQPTTENIELNPDEAEIVEDDAGTIADQQSADDANLEDVQSNEDEIEVDKASPTNIDYEQLCESTDSHDKLESKECVTTNENSIDADTKSIDSKNDEDQVEDEFEVDDVQKIEESVQELEQIEVKSQESENMEVDGVQSIEESAQIEVESQEFDNVEMEEQPCEDEKQHSVEEADVEPEIKLENILSDNISPYDLLDEVVNQEATFMAMEIANDDIDIDLNDPDVEDAAVKIQSAFRGHKMRMEMKSQQDLAESTSIQRDETSADDDVVDDDIKNMVLDDEMEQAALKIQSSFRGHKVRKEHKNMLEMKEDEDNGMDINPIESSSMDEKNESDIEKITNPELLDLTVEEQPSGENDEIRDEILTPDKEESEIPEDEAPQDNIPFPEQESCENQEEIPEPNVMMDDDLEKEESNNNKNSNEEENVEDMILDDEMEGAALKIQAAFRGHQVRKEKTATINDTEMSNQDEEGSNNETIVIEQCSEGNEETQDNDETEQQDTSADVDEIQESEAAEQEENETEETEEVKEDEEAEETTETNEQGAGDPDEPEEQAAEGSTQQETNDDDDVANMVLDEEMEQAALKIQSTFRGHKARSEVKSKQDDQDDVPKEDVPQEENIDDEIANMVLDDEMEQAALKIQSAFRGNRSKKEETSEKTEDEADKQEEEEEKKEEEKKKEEEEKKENEPTTSSEGSSEKTAKQLQEEEDIANLVMDDEMEKTALKIQSAFRGKIKRKTPKDGMESYESSADDYNADAEGSFQRSDENPSDMYDYFGMSVECDEDDYNEYAAAQRESYADDGSYSIERYNAMDAYNETIYPSDNDMDVDLMHGGGIFPETSGESGTLGSMAEYMSEDNNNNNNDPPEDRKDSYKRLVSSSVSDDGNNKEPLSEQKSEEKVIESFDFDSNKDTAEALYYSLKKNEIEAQKRFESTDINTSKEFDDDFQGDIAESNDIMDCQNDDDDDDDVVVSSSSNDMQQKLKYGMSMDDRLLGSILSQDYSKGRKMYPDEMFDPLLEEAMSSNYNVLEKLHEKSKSSEEVLRIDDNNVGDEDQFDDFYPGNIRSKIMASSISIADSDYFDPTNNKSIIDDDRIRTALETIHSTDSESTIGSAATKIQANDKNLTAHRNKNFQYSSIGNAAIDKSLDEFIQSQELRIDRFDEEPEGYNSPPPKKQESVDDFTDDTCTESEKRPTMAGIIEIKLEQKHFLTVDERRRTLHREDAIQRNSTRSVDDETSKSSSASNEKNNLDKNNSQSDVVVTTAVQGQSSVIDTEIAVPVLEKPKASISLKNVKVPIRRQKTMPVQIESNVIRVLPKHLRKRIRSADSDKKKRTHKQ